MPRSRFVIAVSALATALVAMPILSATALAAEPIVIVRPGDTLSGISLRHGVTLNRLVTINRIANPNWIYAGQRLRLEPVSHSHRPRTSTRPVTTARSTRQHTVRSGENLTTIAREYGVTVTAIVRVNRIANPSRIFSGQRFLIPGRAVRPSAPSAAPRMPASMAELAARRGAVRRLIVAEARRYGVPKAFALAVAWQESGWQQGVVSPAGAVGVMQLMPATGDWVGAVMLKTRINIHDTRHNVRAGVRLLAHYLDRYDGDRDRVLAAYYQGQTAVDRYGIYSVSRPYIASIRVLTRIFGG